MLASLVYHTESVAQPTGGHRGPGPPPKRSKKFAGRFCRPASFVSRWPLLQRHSIYCDLANLAAFRCTDATVPADPYPAAAVPDSATDVGHR